MSIQLGRYPPYEQLSPYFRQGQTDPINDAVWNKKRAGTCIGDVFYDFLHDKTYVVGHVDSTGSWSMKLTLLNGPQHRHIHPSGQPAYPLFIINNQGIYKLATPAHYFAPKRAAFVLGEIIHVPFETIPEGTTCHTVSILEGANEINSQDKLIASHVNLTSNITINEGDAICWVSKETITSHAFMEGSRGKSSGEIPDWITPIIPAGCSYFKQFNKAGVYRYTSPVYKWLNGTITVVPRPRDIPPTKGHYMRDKDRLKKLLDLIRARRHR